MANKRSVSLYILETKRSVCRPCSTYHEQHQTAQSLLPCHDSECCSTALSASGLFSKSPWPSVNPPGKQQRGGDGHSSEPCLGLLFINVISHRGILTNIPFTPIFGAVKVPAGAVPGLCDPPGRWVSTFTGSSTSKAEPQHCQLCFWLAMASPGKQWVMHGAWEETQAFPFVHLSGSLLFSSMRDGLYFFFPNAHLIKV